MPSNYAHFRFGGQALAGLDAQLAGCITRERGMFDLGVHGPDFLFYNDPFRRNALEKLGQNVHRATGRAFFTRAAACLRARPDPGAESYLFGALSHFALDSLCHPYIDGLVERGLVRHMALETEFDRQLLALDGVKKPHLYAANRHLRLKKTQQAASIAQFYPGLTDRQVKRCFRRFRLLSGGCVAPRGLRRSILEGGWLGNSARDMMMRLSPDEGMKEFIAVLLEKYGQAQAMFPLLARELWAHIRSGAPLGREFDAVFG